MLLEVENVREMDIPNAQSIAFALAMTTAVSTTFLLICACHAVFFSLMINEFGSLDELTCFVKRLGTLQTLPSRMFMMGLWTIAASFLLYSFAVLGLFEFGILCAGVMGIFFGSHCLIL
jgi:hypothetical protein